MAQFPLLPCHFWLLPLLSQYLVDEYNLGVSRVSEFVAWVGVPIVVANLWLTSFLSARFSIKALTVWSGFLTGALMIVVVLPRPMKALWITLFTSAASALCLPSCATLLSMAAGKNDQGRVMGNNQALKLFPEWWEACLPRSS